MLILLSLACQDGDDLSQPVTIADDCSADGPPAFTAGAAIRIVTDDVGVPHAYAQDDADLMYAAGWLQGRWRLGEIERNRKATRGTLAASEGEGQVVSDLVARLVDFPALACPTLRKIQADRPDDAALADAFVAGLNRARDDVASGALDAPVGVDPAALPEPFTTLDMLAMGKRVSLGYSNQLDYDLLNTITAAVMSDYEALPIYQPAVPRFVEADASPAGPPAPTGDPRLRADVDVHELGARLHALADLHTPDRGSNNWVVSGEYTEDGRPLLANDPHSHLQDPSRFMAYHLDSRSAGGSFDVAGFAFPGVPAVQLGHTRELAWAATTAFADAIDLYDVPVDGDTATIGGETYAVETEEITIQVRLDDGTIEERPFSLRRIPGQGVLLNDEILPIAKNVLADGELLLRWVGFDIVDTALFQYFDLGRAATLDDFRAAIEQEQYGMQNWIGATPTGWTYTTHGQIPVRGGIPSRVMDGTDPDQLWTGAYVDVEALPHVDGDRPYLVSANNDPLGNTADNDPLDDDIYYGSWFDPGFRADRISTELEARMADHKLDLDDMMAVQTDVHSPLAEVMVPRLVATAATIETDEALADWRGRDDITSAVTRLGAWNGNLDADSREAALYRTWLAFLEERILSSDLSILFEEIENASPVTTSKLLALAYSEDNESLLDGQADTAMISALDDALTWLGERGDPTWGEIHVHELDSLFGEDSQFSTGGDETCVNVAKGGWLQDGELTDTSVSWEGAIFRQVTRFGDDGVPETWFNVPGGEASSTADWLSGTYRYFPFRAEEVEAAAVSEITLTP